MVNKILRVGDSAAVTIPKQVLKEMGMSIGDKVNVTYLPELKEVVIKALQTSEPVVSDKMIRLTARFVDRYRPALEQLAKE